MIVASARQSCRSCGAGLWPVLDLGTPTLSGFPRPEDPPLPTVPLVLASCDGCGLVQLTQTVNPEILYRQTYWYRSGINETMQLELADVIHHATTVRPVGGLDTVLDVGANDGTGLRQYAALIGRNRPFRIAFEPASDLVPLLAPACDVVYNDFFPGKASGDLPPRSVAILTSIAMFYDLDDPKAFVAEVDRLLTDDGVWVVQMQDLLQMIERTAYDNVCFEHLTYYSLASFAGLLRNFDLDVDAVEPRAINGGSLRITVRRRTKCRYVGVETWLRREVDDLGYHQLQQFAHRVSQHRTQLQGIIEATTARDWPIDLYAASTKANTLLQYCRLDATVIRQAVERTPEKVGRVTAGTHIPIVSEAQWRKDPAPVTLVGAWAFREAFLQREADYLKGGGMFLLPLPKVEVVRADLPVV